MSPNLLNQKIKKSNSEQSNVIYLGKPETFQQFQSDYLIYLEKTNSIYSDDELTKLPFNGNNSLLFEDWKLKALSYKRLVNIFSKRKNNLILEIGAGNCWLGNKLSLETSNFVYALDINLTELEQASRVFSDNKRIKFFYGDIFDDIFEFNSFDAIIIASALQFFDNFPALINRLIRYLKLHSEIHVLDSPFFPQHKIKTIKDADKKYFQKIGVPAMAKHYHYHTWKELKRFRYTVLNRQEIFRDTILNKFNNKKMIRYPHILIKT